MKNIIKNKVSLFLREKYPREYLIYILVHYSNCFTNTECYKKSNLLFTEDVLFLKLFGIFTTFNYQTIFVLKEIFSTRFE